MEGVASYHSPDSLLFPAQSNGIPSAGLPAALRAHPRRAAPKCQPKCKILTRRERNHLRRQAVYTQLVNRWENALSKPDYHELLGYSLCSHGSSLAPTRDRTVITFHFEI